MLVLLTDDLRGQAKLVRRPLQREIGASSPLGVAEKVAAPRKENLAIRRDGTNVRHRRSNRPKNVNVPWVRPCHSQSFT
jgi:hypothetical protein